MVDYTESPLLATLRGQTSEPHKAIQETIIDQIRLGLEELYCHLPQKKSAFGIDPIAQLRILRAGGGTNFTRSILKIVNGLRDRHTTLRLAPPWSDLTAYVPIRIEVAADSGAPEYIVTKQFFGFDEIPVGARITHWNGVPMLLHHFDLADKSQGGNLSASLRLALSNMTVRPLAYLLMPNEDWVTLTYIDPDGDLRTASTPWRFFFAPSSALASGSQGESGLGGLGAATATSIGLDELGLLTASFVKSSTRETEAAKAGAMKADNGLTRDGNLAFGARATSTGTCAYLRIFSFNEADPKGYVEKVAEILENLPQDRLIIDIRGNPGGTIPAGQGLIRLLKTGPLTSSTIAFRATDYMAEIASASQFGEWQESLAIQTKTGNQFSQAFTISDFEDLPEYRYPGKIALIIDAECYSTSDFFAADFADNKVGIVLGTDLATGGGGANVWSWETLLFFAASAGVPSVVPLPAGYSFNVSMRRAYRTGALSGLPIEDLGVSAQPEDIHRLTVNDLLHENVDLMEFAAAKLR